MTLPSWTAIAAVTHRGHIALQETTFPECARDLAHLRHEVQRILTLSDIEIEARQQAFVVVGRKTWETHYQALKNWPCIVVSRGLITTNNPNHLIWNPDLVDYEDLARELNINIVRLCCLGGSRPYGMAIRNLAHELIITAIPDPISEDAPGTLLWPELDPKIDWQPQLEQFGFQKIQETALQGAPAGWNVLRFTRLPGQQHSSQIS